MSVATESHTAAAEFVARFDEGWRAGRPGVLERLAPLIDPDVLLTQPLLPPARGREEFRESFERVFAVIPDLRGEVLSWGETADGVIVELVLRGTLGSRSVEVVTCDRIVLRDGRILERHARFDPLPFVAAALASPRAALGFVSALVSSRGGSGGDRALAGLAAGRIALGVLGRLAPRRTAQAFGAGDAASPELDYMTRVFGARAFALGTGYLASDGEARRLWQRLAFVCDVSDTLAGIADIRRGEVRRSSAVAATALTGGYMLVGAARVARDLGAS